VLQLAMPRPPVLINWIVLYRDLKLDKTLMAAKMNFLVPMIFPKSPPVAI